MQIIDDDQNDKNRSGMETERDDSHSVIEENVSLPTLTTGDSGTDSSRDEVSDGAMELHDEVSSGY